MGPIRKAAVTSAADSDSRQLRRVVDTTNTADDVWTDSAYRSSKNEAWLKSNMLKSRIHGRKTKGRPMPENMARANAAKSVIRARLEHVFAHQKNRYGLFIRPIGSARAQAKLTLANLAYDFDRLIFHQRSAVTGSVCAKSTESTQKPRIRSEEHQPGRPKRHCARVGQQRDNLRRKHQGRCERTDLFSIRAENFTQTQSSERSHTKTAIR